MGKRLFHCFIWGFSVLIAAIPAGAFISCGSHGCAGLDQVKLTTGAHWRNASRTVLAFSITLLDLSENTLPVTWSDGDPEKDSRLTYDSSDPAYARIDITYNELGGPSAGDYIYFGTPYYVLKLEYGCPDNCQTLDSVRDDTGECVSVDSTHRRCTYSLAADDAIESNNGDPIGTLRGSIDIEQEEVYLPENESECVYAS